jgi:hypothetical protein
MIPPESPKALPETGSTYGGREVQWHQAAAASFSTSYQYLDYRHCPSMGSPVSCTVRWQFDKG